MTQLPSSSSQQSNTTLVVVAVVLAFIAAILVFVYVSMVRSAATSGQFVVYRLASPVSPGDKLDENDVYPVAIPKGFADSFKNALDQTGLEARVGDVFRRGARANAVLTADLFIDPDEDRLDLRISMGMRLIALPVNQKTLPGSLRPGMYVDIAASFPSSDGRPNVLPVMELVEVMSVGEKTVIDEQSSIPSRSSRSSRYAKISIEVTPTEATQLSRIQKIVLGDFELHVRKPADVGRPNMPEGGINPAVLRLLDSYQRF